MPPDLLAHAGYSEIASSSSDCNLYDGAKNYRLGDVTGSRWFRHTSGGLPFHLQNFPKSLAAQFLRGYGHGTPAYRAYYNATCWPRCAKSGYCQCYVPRAHALHEILERERVSAIANASAGGKHGGGGLGAHARLSHTAAVHLRVGDVVDQSPHSLDEMLRRTTRFSTRCSASATKEGCLSISPVVYVQPLARYDSVIARFRELDIRRVVIVAASSVNQSWSGKTWSHAKSCDYVRRMGRHFAAAGFKTAYRLGQQPDDDFRFFSRVACMVPSLSGFGGLAGQVAQKFGVHIIMPEGLTLPTFDLTG